MSSVPLTGSIIGNLGVACSLGGVAVLSVYPFQGSEKDEAVCSSSNDYAKGASALILGGGALGVFTYGVAIPLGKKIADGAKRSFEWVQSYRCRLDGALAFSIITSGVTTVANNTGSIPLMAAGTAVAAAGVGYLYGVEGAISSAPGSRVTPSAPSMPTPKPTTVPGGEIKEGTPLHVDYPMRMRYRDHSQISFQSPAAAFVGSMVTKEYVCTNRDYFLQTTGSQMLQAIDSLGEDDLKPEHQKSNQQLLDHNITLMDHILKKKYGVGESRITEAQKYFRAQLKATKGNFIHPAFGNLISSVQMTNLLKDIYETVMDEDSRASVSSSSSSSFRSTSSQPFSFGASGRGRSAFGGGGGDDDDQPWGN